MSEKSEQEKGPDVVSDQEKELAKNALLEFKRKNFGFCLQNINKLENLRPNDFKVLHNKAVAEYYRSDSKKTENFQKALTSICNQFNIKVDKLEELDYCIAQFNQAILLYHQRQYMASQRIMDRVYKFIEPMEESLAKQVSLLAIELQLCLRQPDKALTLINYLENNLMYGGSIPLKGLDKGNKEKKIQLPPPKPISEEFQKKLLKYKVRCFIMNHSVSLLPKEVQNLLKDKGKVDAFFLSANSIYFKGNFGDALTILSAIPEDTFIYNECGDSAKIMINNNMGVVYHAMGKPNLACHHFQTALKEDIRISQETSKKDDNEKALWTLGGSKYHEIMYNLGVSLLYAGRAAQAFECLIICVRRYHRNSRLWLRLAECCIMVHKESNEVDFDIQRRQKELIVEVVGSNDKQKVVLVSNISKDKKYSTDSQSYAVPVPSLEFASLCLRNAYLLIPSDTETPPVPLFLIPGVTPPAPPPSPSLSPSNPQSADGIAQLRNGILTASAYVALCLGDYVVALEHSKELLQQPKLSGVHKFLGHLYSAECLVLSNKIQEALEHLKPENVTELSFTFPPTEGSDDCSMNTAPPPSWSPNSLASAHAVMHYNMAVAKCIKGQLDQAATILKQVWQQRAPNCQVPAHIIMLVIYIELQLANGLSFEINFDENESKNEGGVIQKPPPRRLQKLMEEEHDNEPVTLEKLQEKLETAEHRRKEILLQRMRSATLLTVPKKANGIQSSNFSSLDDENLETSR